MLEQYNCMQIFTQIYKLIVYENWVKITCRRLLKYISYSDSGPFVLQINQGQYSMLHNASLVINIYSTNIMGLLYERQKKTLESSDS